MANSRVGQLMYKSIFLRARPRDGETPYGSCPFRPKKYLKNKSPPKERARPRDGETPYCFLLAPAHPHGLGLQGRKKGSSIPWFWIARLDPPYVSTMLRHNRYNIWIPFSSFDSNLNHALMNKGIRPVGNTQQWRLDIVYSLMTRVTVVIFFDTLIAIGWHHQ